MILKDRIIGGCQEAYGVAKCGNESVCELDGVTLMMGKLGNRCMSTSDLRVHLLTFIQSTVAAKLFLDNWNLVSIRSRLHRLASTSSRIVRLMNSHKPCSC